MSVIELSEDDMLTCSLQYWEYDCTEEQQADGWTVGHVLNNVSEVEHELLHAALTQTGIEFASVVSGQLSRFVNGVGSFKATERIILVKTNDDNTIVCREIEKLPHRNEFFVTNNPEAALAVLEGNVNAIVFTGPEASIVSFVKIDDHLRDILLLTR